MWKIALLVHLISLAVLFSQIQYISKPLTLSNLRGSFFLFWKFLWSCHLPDLDSLTPFFLHESFFLSLSLFCNGLGFNPILASGYSTAYASDSLYVSCRKSGADCLYSSQMFFSEGHELLNKLETRSKAQVVTLYLLSKDWEIKIVRLNTDMTQIVQRSSNVLRCVLQLH